MEVGAPFRPPARESCSDGSLDVLAGSLCVLTQCAWRAACVRESDAVLTTQAPWCFVTAAAGTGDGEVNCGLERKLFQAQRLRRGQCARYHGKRVRGIQHVVFQQLAVFVNHDHRPLLWGRPQLGRGCASALSYLCVVLLNLQPWLADAVCLLSESWQKKNKKKQTFIVSRSQLADAASNNKHNINKHTCEWLTRYVRANC